MDDARRDSGRNRLEARIGKKDSRALVEVGTQETSSSCHEAGLPNRWGRSPIASARIVRNYHSCHATQFSFGLVRTLLSCQTKPLCKTPLFLEDLLSGADNGRDRLIRARSGLVSTEDYPRFQRGVCLGG